MALPFPEPRHLPCSDCGAAVERSKRDEHACDREQLVGYQIFQLRDEIDALEAEVAVYFGSARGRFDLWCAERDRNNRSGSGL